MPLETPLPQPLFPSSSPTFDSLSLSGNLVVGRYVGVATDSDLLDLTANQLIVNGSTILPNDSRYIMKNTSGANVSLIWVDTGNFIRGFAGGINVNSTADNFGFGTGTSNINLTGYSGAVMTIYHSSLSANLELSTGTSDGENLTAGTVGGCFKSNSGSPSNRQIGAIDFITEGTSAGNRGGKIQFRVRADGSAGGASTQMTLHNDGRLEIDGTLDHDGNNVGFYGVAPAARQTVTGSRGGNAALTSLLTALATIGLIVDSTSP